MDRSLKFYGIFSTQIVAILWPKYKFVSMTNGVYKRSYLFWMNITETIFEIRSCIEILMNDIKLILSSADIVQKLNSGRQNKTDNGPGRVRNTDAAKLTIH